MAALIVSRRLADLRTQIEALLHQPALGRHGHQWPTVQVRGRDLRLRYRVEGSYVRLGAATQPLYLLVVRASGPQFCVGAPILELAAG